MRRQTTTLLMGLLMAVGGCGEVREFDGTPPMVFGETADYPMEPPALLGVDGARSGVVDFEDPDDLSHRYEPDDGYGALFLANIDDDDGQCVQLDDEGYEGCFDAAIEGIGGEADLSDMARVETYPTGPVSPGTTGVLDVDDADEDRINLYRNTGEREGPEGFEPYEPGVDEIGAEALEEGVEFAIEGTGLIGDRRVWDGTVELIWEIEVSEFDRRVRDRAHLEQAPLLLRHHLDGVDELYAADLGSSNRDFVEDLGDATMAADLEEGLELLDLSDPWTRDYMLNGYMAIPGPDGPRAIQVYFRSANLNYPGSLESIFETYYQLQGESLPPLLREAGRVVYSDFHGSDSAGEAIYDADKGFEPVDVDDDIDEEDVIAYLFGGTSDESYPDIEDHYRRVMGADTLDSFGNTEVVPPHVGVDGESHPHGRIVRGRGDDERMRPDPTMSTLLEAQDRQAPIWIDTAWLTVAHVDETISFVASDNERGWTLMYNDPVRARKLLQEVRDDQGAGDTPVFEGKSYRSGQSAERTVDEILDDTDVMASSARAAVEVDAQVETIRREVELEDDELVPIPFLHQQQGDGLAAYQPGIINGTSLRPDVFAAPDPHGPVVDGEDVFEADVQQLLGELGVDVHWVETWNTYHLGLGQVHCGTNSTRELPETPWWQKEHP